MHGKYHMLIATPMKGWIIHCLSEGSDKWYLCWLEVSSRNEVQAVHRFGRRWGKNFKLQMQC